MDVNVSSNKQNEGDPLITVCEEFGLGEMLNTPERIGEGVDKDMVWKVVTTNGVWAVKANKATVDPDKVETGVRFERELWDAGISLPLPHLTTSGSGKMLLPSGQIISVREWVNAPSASWHPQEREAEPALLLASLLARLHKGDWTNTGSVSIWATQRREEPHWAELLAAARKQDHPWKDALVEALPRIMWAEEIIENASETDDFCMCHLDANPHNILIVDDQRICIIDWDGAGLASASGEIISVISNWACNGNGTPYKDLPARMLEAYRANGGICDTNSISIFAQHLVGWLNWIEFQIELAISQTSANKIKEMDEAVTNLLVWTQRIEGIPALLQQLS